MRIALLESRQTQGGLNEADRILVRNKLTRMSEDDKGHTFGASLCRSLELLDSRSDLLGRSAFAGGKVDIIGDLFVST